jgi:hypothetical protein
MADANRLAAALRYQQDMEGPVTMNPNIAEQGRKGRANMAPPTSVMDPRSRDYERRSKETENFLIGADILAGALPFAPLAKGAAMAAGRYAGPELARGLENYMVKSGAVLPMDVWHGSPHRFPPTAKNPLGEFDPMKIGTGEGAQAYGVGAGYLAENPGVAKEYAKNLSENRLFDAKNAPFDVQTNLSNPNVRAVLHKTNGDIDAAIARARQAIEAIPGTQGAEYAAKDIRTLTALKSAGGLQKQGGYLYKVDLPDEHIAKMLDWDKPLSQQHPDVQKALDVALDTHFTEEGAKHVRNMGWPSSLFEGWATENPALTSEALRKSGVPGIRYLDAGSRTGGAGTSNFVVFDPAHMNIIGRE